MPKQKRKTPATHRKPKADFAQTAFSVFQKAIGVKPKAHRQTRSGRGK